MKKHLSFPVTLLLCAPLAAALASCGGSGTSEESAGETETPKIAAAEMDAAKPAASTRPARSGAEIFAAHCSYCHAAGEENPGTFQLAATRGADYAVLEEREDLTAEYVAYIVRRGLNAMPPFTPTIITDAELASLGDYLATDE